MTTEELIKTDDVPTLNCVIEVGDEAIIQTTRISNQIGHELDSNLGPTLSQEIIQTLASRPTAGLTTAPATELNESTSVEFRELSEDVIGYEGDFEPEEMNPDETLELMIDTIVDRHITTLRQDIRRLLERAIAER